jgi:hypothetical protein
MDWQEIKSVVDAEFVCNHTLRLLAVKVATNGTRHYRRQCQRCGSWEAVKRQDYSGEQLRAAVPFDEQIIKEWLERRLAREVELRTNAADAEREEWFERYNEYLDSEQWRRKRQKVLERDRFLCRACCTREATQVHHLTYKHVFDEPLFDLVSVCHQCHEKLTRMDRP